MATDGRSELSWFHSVLPAYEFRPSLNPFTATACQISGLNDALTRLETVYLLFL